MELAIIIVAALTGAEVGEIVHELDRRDPPDHLKPSSFSQHSRSGAPRRTLTDAPFISWALA